MFWHRNIVLRFQRFLLNSFIRFLYSLLKTFCSEVLTSKSLIGSNDYPRLVLDLKWNFGLDLQHNIERAFWETKSTYFCSKMLYSTNFCLKRTVWTYKGLYFDRNTVLKCFDTKISYYCSKGFCWIHLYDSFTLYSKLFHHKFWRQNLSFGFKWLPSACFGPQMKFWFGFEA
jgi:hypothetical protein